MNVALESLLWPALDHHLLPVAQAMDSLQNVTAAEMSACMMFQLLCRLCGIRVMVGIVATVGVP